MESNSSKEMVRLVKMELGKRIRKEPSEEQKA